jgi:TPR repeat protein
MHYRADGVKQSYSEAREWFDRAANGGDPDGMKQLARMLERGEGGPRDVEQSAQWLEKAVHAAANQAKGELQLLLDRGSQPYLPAHPR